MNPGKRTNVLPEWLLSGDYDKSASDRETGLYVKQVGFRYWEWFVHTPNGSYRGWAGWATNLKQAWHNGLILAANPGGVSWSLDTTEIG